MNGAVALNPDTTALLLLGLQNDYLGAQGALASRGLDTSPLHAALPHITELVTSARNNDLLIVHCPEIALPYGLSDSPAWAARQARNGAKAQCVEGTWGSEPPADFAAGLRDLTSPRYRSSALLDSRTVVLLRSNGIRSVVICGFELHDGVLATAATAACLDFDVVVPADSAASTDISLSRAALIVLPTWATVSVAQEVIHGWARHSPEMLD